MQARKKNMERMAEVVPGSNDQALQHFLSNSNWSERAVLDQVALEANELLGGTTDSALLIDESGFAKKGEKSVGVARQWNGRLGKVDNCQVGVFAGLNNGIHTTLIDVRLFLPSAWANDKARCIAAGIPKAARVSKAKPTLALEMIRHNRNLGVGFSWVGADGLYGKDPAFLRALDDDGEVFVVDVHKDQRIYLEDPEPMIPPTPNKRGRKRTRRVAQSKAIRVDKWQKAQSEASWEEQTLRDSTQGKLQVEVLHRRVWLWDGKEEHPRQWHLIVRREVKAKKEITYSLSNAPENTSILRLAQMQGQRFWIERAFQDGKSHAGLGDYQVRGWKSWHHHMSLVLVAMLFMLEQRMAVEEDCPLLSCADVETLLAHFLPRRDGTVVEVIRQLRIRHRKRQATIDNAYEKQKLKQKQTQAAM
jgi:SRSO17 transposase